MIRLIVLLSIAITSLWGVTATPTSVSLYMRAGSGLGYSWSGTRTPKRTAITVTGTGSWNLSRGGALATACGSAFGYCFNVSTSATATGGGALPTGSGPATLYLYWDGLGSESLLPGMHTGTLTVGTTVINIILSVEPRRSFDAFAYPPGFPSGCSNSFVAFTHADTCTITNERPSSAGFSIPPPGGSYTDPQFGHTVWRVTGAGQNIQYGALSAFSATAKYVLTSGTTGQVNVYNRAGTLVYASIAGPNINFAAWDPYDDERLWFMDGASIKYRQLNTGVLVTAANYASAAGPRPAFPGITMGGTVDITDDGWWAFRDGSNFNTMCAVNLNGLTTSNQESKTFCGNLSALNLTDFDFTQITQVDSETRKRYVIAVAAPQGHVFSVGATGLDYEYPLPTGSDDISAEPHSDVGQDSEGRQIFFWNWYTPYDNRYFLAAAQLNKGADMTRPVEEGGGLRLLYLSDPGNFNTDAHFGCTWKGVCSYTPYGNSGGISVGQISSAAAGNPCAVTTASPHGFNNGAQVMIGGGAGMDGINGIFTISVTGTTTFTLTGQSCSGVYTAGSAHVVINNPTAPTQPNRQEIVVARPGHEVRRVAIHRSKIYNGGSLLGYFATPRASISRDGRYIAFASNYGVPEHPSVWLADLGAPTTTTRLLVKAVDAASSQAVLNYEVPAGEAGATILVSASPSLSNPVVNAADGLSGTSRQYVLTGLAAQTDYWYRITTGRYATQGQFRTMAPLTGTSVLRVERGGGGSIQHGPTSSLGFTSASPLLVTVNRGLYYYNAGSGVQAVVVR
jgi:hypothetical protein